MKKIPGQLFFFVFISAFFLFFFSWEEARGASGRISPNIRRVIDLISPESGMTPHAIQPGTEQTEEAPETASTEHPKSAMNPVILGQPVMKGGKLSPVFILAGTGTLAAITAVLAMILWKRKQKEEEEEW